MNEYLCGRGTPYISRAIQEPVISTAKKEKWPRVSQVIDMYLRSNHYLQSIVIS